MPRMTTVSATTTALGNNCSAAELLLYMVELPFWAGAGQVDLVLCRSDITFELL